MFGRLGPVELLLILAVVLVIFGPRKLPEIGSAIGKAIQSLREGLKKKSSDGETKNDAAADGRAPDGNKPDPRRLNNGD